MNNPTIDGVSRELLEEFIALSGQKKYGNWIDLRNNLRALLDAGISASVKPTNELREHCKQCAEVVKAWPEWKRDCLGGAPAVERQEPVALHIPEECPHLIVFDDADRENLMFSGAGARGAAMKTWEQISMSWNAHLFVRVQRNSRDDRYPSATATALKSTIAQLRQHKNDYMEAAEETRKALTDDVARLKSRVAELESGRGEIIHQVRTHGSDCWEDISGESLELCQCDPEEYEIRKVFTAAPAPTAVVLPKYTCIGKGGEYELLGSAVGAGTLKEMSPIPVYRDRTTGQLFVRTPLDFATRMACLDTTAALNGPAK